MPPSGLYVPVQLQSPVSQADGRKPARNAQPHAKKADIPPSGVSRYKSCAQAIQLRQKHLSPALLPIRKRGCLKMIFDDHERQLPFLREAVKKLLKNSEKQRTNSEGQSLPLKKVRCFCFGDAMQRSGQPGAFPTGLFVLYDAASEGYKPCSQDTIPPRHWNSPGSENAGSSCPL